ncbi:MAG: hypothetical protein ACKVRO_05060 [Micropepsaceae bacterium]
MQIWLARVLAVLAIAVGALVTFEVMTFPKTITEAQNSLDGAGVFLLVTGVFLLIFSLRRTWFSNLDNAVFYAIIAIFAAGAAYSVFVLRSGEAAILHLLMMVYFIWARFAQAERASEPFRVSAGRFLLVMGTLSAALVGGIGIALLISGPDSPVGYGLTAFGAVFLGIAYVAKRFLLRGAS